MLLKILLVLLMLMLLLLLLLFSLSVLLATTKTLAPALLRCSHLIDLTTARIIQGSTQRSGQELGCLLTNAPQAH